jgi:hypothetical protein
MRRYAATAIAIGAVKTIWTALLIVISVILKHAEMALALSSVKTQFPALMTAVNVGIMFVTHHAMKIKQHAHMTVITAIGRNAATAIAMRTVKMMIHVLLIVITATGKRVVTPTAGPFVKVQLIALRIVASVVMAGVTNRDAAKVILIVILTVGRKNPAYAAMDIVQADSGAVKNSVARVTVRGEHTGNSSPDFCLNKAESEFIFLRRYLRF